MRVSLAVFQAAAALCLAISPALAQTAAPSSASQPPSQTQDQQPKGKVIFSRSIDENGQVTTTTATPQTSDAPKVQSPSPQVAPKKSVEPFGRSQYCYTPLNLGAPGPSQLGTGDCTHPGYTSSEDALADDNERQAVTFTSLDMDVRLRSAEQHIAVRAIVTVRNDGKAPLARIPLQLSSSLNWERVRVAGKDVAFSVATLNSDADHTGQLHEAAVPLAQPLAPGASLQLDVTYSGLIAASAQRLLTIGTPGDVALHSDWDQIGTSFTGLRGFGNVVWYPASSVPQILGDGARLFDEIGKHKLRLVGAHFRLRLTVEFPHGSAPTVALINGHLAALTVTEAKGPEPIPGQDLDPSQQIPGVATASLDDETLGFESPSLFVAIRQPHVAQGISIWALSEDQSTIADWSSSAAAVEPLLQRWLGDKPRSQLTLLDLPDPRDAPFETGALLATALRPASAQDDAKADPDQFDGILVHALTHAYLHTSTHSPPAWLDEGVANFIGTLWVENQHGRAQALATLEASRPALALAEPESPGESAGQPLAEAISPVYYRTKAAYVFWMLRDLIGDPALRSALRSYDPAAGPGAQDAASSGQDAASSVKVAGFSAKGTGPNAQDAASSAKGTGFSAKGTGLNAQDAASSAKGTGPNAQDAASIVKGTGFSPYIDPSQSHGALAPEGSPSLRSPFEKLLLQAKADDDKLLPPGSEPTHTDLSWFFADWIDADKGLPDLKIDGVFPTTAEAGNWLVAVQVSNSGFAACEVPVTVRAESNSATQRLMVPARGKAVQRILILGKPTEVQVNDGTVPETQATIHITKIGDAASGIPPAEPPQQPHD